jgi:ABC-type dipeptide/oligopeptide/nickel transport system permease subunit
MDEVSLVWRLQSLFAIMASVLALNLMGDGLNDALNTRLRHD